MENTPPTSIPVAKSFSLKELPGWLGKSILIPPGKQGVVIDAAGKCRLLPPGKTQILSPFARLGDGGMGLRAGYVPAEPFDLAACYANLVCGDDAKLDADLILWLKVIDPERFFKSLVVPVGELTELPHLGKDLIHDGIGEVLSHYEREDILRRIPTTRLAGEIKEQIAAAFPAMGLELLNAPILLFRASEDRPQVAEKIADLESRLSSAGKDEQAEEVEKIAGGILPESAGLRSLGKRPLDEVINNLRTLHTVEKAPRPHWRLAALHAARPEELDPRTKNALGKWKLLEIIWIIFLLATGIVVTYLLFQLPVDWKSAEIIGFLVGIWGLIITSLIASVKKLVEKKEELILRGSNWQNIEKNRINLADRREVDRLVREQCSRELQHAGEVLNEIRAGVYRSGDTRLALNIKELEQEFLAKKNKILSPNFGAPYYLKDPSISESDWEKLLTLEEGVLKQSNVLGEMVEEFRSAKAARGEEELDEIARQLYRVESLFFDRSRLN